MDRAYESKDAVRASMSAYALDKGFVATTKRSDKRKIVFQCDRGGEYKNCHNLKDDNRQRRTSTRRSECKWEAKAVLKSDGLWHLRLKNPDHNHETSTDGLKGHPGARKMRQEQKDVVKNMSTVGAAPSTIIASLREADPETRIIARDIYNVKQKIREENLAGKTPIQAFLHELRTERWVYDYRADDKGHITHLFFAEPFQVQLTKRFHHVLLLDCTYKTNKFNMPLLEVVGVTCCNTTFSCCYAFLREEKVDDYVWALERLAEMIGDGERLKVMVTDRELALMNAKDVVFPNANLVLCNWHIHKNIGKNCKHHFSTADGWTAFMSDFAKLECTVSEDDFERTWSEFRATHAEKEDTLAYLTNNWMPYKMMFVRAWVDRLPHLGNRATSRAEGTHATLKRTLRVSTGNLHEVLAKTKLVILKERRELDVRVEEDKIQVQLAARKDIFSLLHGKVSRFALGQLAKQLQLRENNEMPRQCRGIFTATMKLPCAHKLATYVETHTRVPLDDIDPQWHLTLEPVSEAVGEAGGEEGGGEELGEVGRVVEGLVQTMGDLPPLSQRQFLNNVQQLVANATQIPLEPVRAVTRGRPRNDSSTRRNPSGFELAERPRRRCGLCGQIGHNARSCNASTSQVNSSLLGSQSASTPAVQSAATPTPIFPPMFPFLDPFGIYNQR